jgi:hypothetical protein
MELAVITTKNKLATRGQYIGGALGAIGLIGSLVIAGRGQGWAGFGIALTSLGSLVSIFVYGREEQKKERLDKERLREQLRRGEPIEDLEKADRAPGKPKRPPRSTQAPGKKKGPTAEHDEG